MGFDSAKAVSPLDFDFTAHGGPKGTIPEPTQEALDAFYERGRAIIAGAGIEDIARLSDDSSEAEIIGVLAKLDMESFQSLQGDLAVAVGELCQGTPSTEEIQALPVRVRQAFIGWVFGEIADPTFARAATSSSQATPNGAGPAT